MVDMLPGQSTNDENTADRSAELSQDELQELAKLVYEKLLKELTIENERLGRLV